jgi:predicted DNA-binding transcriptional regulator YafY
MTKRDDSNTKLSLRLADMMQRLNEGMCLRPKELAEEYRVSLRTIQRDLNERFAFLHLEETPNGYKMADYCLGKLSTKDIQRFASLAGISGLFPALDRDFLRSILDATLSEAYLVKGVFYEDTSAYKVAMKALEAAITKKQCVSFIYKDKSRKHIHPYKMVNHKGCWYLAATEEGELKSYKMSGINELTASPQVFKPDSLIIEQLKNDDTIWYSKEKMEVVLAVAPEVAPYFERRKLTPSQEISKKLADGGLIVSCKVTHENQIIPIVRYWIPHVRFISPAHWQEEVEKSIEQYLKKR